MGCRLFARALSLNPPIHVPKTNPDHGDLRDPPLTGSCSSSQDRTILALRISVGSDGGEEVPVGFPGVEKGADSVVREVG